MAEETMTCPVCGKEFLPYNIKVQKYCSAECRQKEMKRRNKEYYKSYHHKHKKVKNEPLFGSRAQVKSKPLDSLSGEELLHYGSIQIQENMEHLRVHKNMERGGTCDQSTTKGS